MIEYEDKFCLQETPMYWHKCIDTNIVLKKKQWQLIMNGILQDQKKFTELLLNHSQKRYHIGNNWYSLQTEQSSLVLKSASISKTCCSFFELLSLNKIISSKIFSSLNHLFCITDCKLVP